MCYKHCGLPGHNVVESVKQTSDYFLIFINGSIWDMNLLPNLPQVGGKAISECTLSTPTWVSCQMVLAILLHWSGLHRSAIICQNSWWFLREESVIVPLHMLYYKSCSPWFSTQSECFHLSQEFQTLHCSIRNDLQGRVHNSKLKSASKIVHGVFNEPEVKKHFSELHVNWTFNLEKAPWWGHVRMYDQVCETLFEGVAGRTSLTYDELSMFITEIEAVLNSRPLTYVSMDDLEEPLTPSHLLRGYRVLLLPDPPLCGDPDYGESANDLSRRMRHLLMTSEKFWKRWKKEYLLELKRISSHFWISKGVKDEGQIVIIYAGQPSGLWSGQDWESNFRLRWRDSERSSMCAPASSIHL